MLKKTYITFGQSHVHSVKGKTFDKDCVACITHDEKVNGRDIAFQLFGKEWSRSFREGERKLPYMRCFPRGVIEVDEVFI